MKLRILIFVGILTILIGLPMVSSAIFVGVAGPLKPIIPITTPITSTIPTVPSVVGGCMVLSTSLDQITCVFNTVNSLTKRIDALEQRISVLESRAVPTPPIYCPTGCTCSGYTITCPATSNPVINPLNPPISSSTSTTTTSNGCLLGQPYNTTTGQKCTTTTPTAFPSGCTSIKGYSTTTGHSCSIQ